VFAICWSGVWREKEARNLELLSRMHRALLMPVNHGVPNFDRLNRKLDLRRHAV
jgi:hypothetical protein